MRTTQRVLFLLMFFVMWSCSKEEFATKTNTNTTVANTTTSYQLSTCSRFTEEKPPVDILFVVDNSSSTYTPDFVQLKSELQNLIGQVSEDFDYHIVIAPLLAPSNENNLTSFQVVASSQQGLNPVSTNLIQPENVQFFAPVSGGSTEHGFARVRNIINANISNNVFRPNAHTIAVMISNGDDNDVVFIQGQPTNTSNHDYEEDFKKFSKNHPSSTLNAIQFRFLSLVAFTNCGTGFKAGNRYRAMSSAMYNYAQATDSPTQDQYNLCNGSYASVFAGINESIKKIIIGHRYNYWPISTNPNALIEPTDITVTKIKPDGTAINIPEDSLNGFTYDPNGNKFNQPIRYYPTIGEFSDGLFIQLHGSAEVTYPDCLLVKTTSPIEYFGYIALSRKPVESSIQIQINGQNINPSTTNGWSYVGYSPNLNIKVPGPDNKPINPPLYKTGYMIKLHGSAIYTNGDKINVSYKPDAI